MLQSFTGRVAEGTQKNCKETASDTLKALSVGMARAT